MIVLHYTAMQTVQAAADRLCDPAYEVSAHYLIGADGSVLQLVAEDMRAWHAGAGSWGGITDVNSHSIGIELANTGRSPFAAAQMNALDGLLPKIMARWQIPPERIIGHSDMAPDRKSDPGPRFDWARLARQGVAIATPPLFTLQKQSPPEAPNFAKSTELATLRAALSTLGYTPDLSLESVLAAFRLRFRPQATGSVDKVDLALATHLAARFPVDRAADTA